jgi:hypothetical protein
VLVARPRSRRRWVRNASRHALVAALLLPAPRAGPVLAWHGETPPDGSQPADQPVTVLYESDGADLALSPDGSRVASLRGDELCLVTLAELDRPFCTTLPGRNDWFATWSPDSSRVVVSPDYAFETAAGPLLVVEVTGTVTLLQDVVPERRFWAGAFLDDDSIVFATTSPAVDAVVVEAVDVTGGSIATPIPIEMPGGTAVPFEPFSVVDGLVVGNFVGPDHDEDGPVGIWTVDAATGSHRHLLGPDSERGGPVLLGAGLGYAVVAWDQTRSSAYEGVDRLALLPLNGDELVYIPVREPDTSVRADGGLKPFDAAISADGDRIAVTFACVRSDQCEHRGGPMPNQLIGVISVERLIAGESAWLDSLAVSLPPLESRADSRGGSRVVWSDGSVLVVAGGDITRLDLPG